MKLGIIGGYGFLGYKMAKIARGMGIDVVLGDLKQHVTTDGFAFQKIDITSAGKCDAFFSCHDIDIAILTAAQTNVDLCEQDEKMAFSINADGPANVATICKKYGVNLVYLSTDFVFDGNRGNYTENATPNPINVYGKSKLAGETHVSRILPDALICRTSVLYGNKEPFQHDNFVQWVINKLANKNSISIVHDQLNNPTLIDNLAIILLKLIQGGKRGIWHTAGSQCLSRFEFSVKIARAYGFDEALIQPIMQLKQIALRPKNACLDVSKLMREMGIIPLSVDEGIVSLKPRHFSHHL